MYYRLSMDNPATEVMFIPEAANPWISASWAQRVIRPTVEAIQLEWYL
jgi:hypothetical protein